jgi:uncharacterized membrane protein YphA (DoxX/SURF4 family)
MISNSKTVNAVVSTISYLYALLFIYAATSKLLDFDTFRIQLGQSPLLSVFADWISISVPGIEIVITVMLLSPKFRLVGLYASYLLMSMFTTYIHIILNYSAFVPCSCGGILQKMTWDQHLIFNIVFILLAIIAIIIFPINNNSYNCQTIKS